MVVSPRLDEGFSELHSIVRIIFNDSKVEIVYVLPVVSKESEELKKLTAGFVVIIPRESRFKVPESYVNGANLNIGGLRITSKREGHKLEINLPSGVSIVVGENEVEKLCEIDPYNGHTTLNGLTDALLEMQSYQEKLV